MNLKMVVFVASRNEFEEFDLDQDVFFRNSEGKDISLSDLVVTTCMYSSEIKKLKEELASLERLFIKKVINNE